MTQRQSEYAAQLRRQGFRVTPQRQLILDAIRAGRGHTTPEEICARVRARMPVVNRATIYRNLDVLCEARLVVAVQIGRQMYYEIAGDAPHHHLVCRTCGHVDRVAHATVRTLFARVKREKGFLVDMDHLTLFGLCAGCQAGPV